MSLSKKWLEIKASGPAVSKDAVIKALVDAGSPGVQEDEVYSPEDLILSHSSWTSSDNDLVEEVVEEQSAATARLTAYLNPEFKGLKQLRKEFLKLGWSFSSSPYSDEDWSEKWKASLKIIRIAGYGRTVVVKPGWKKVAKRAGDVIIDIDPGMAFGTGGHETTKMCLKAMLWTLKGRRPAAWSFLDVGTGSGVLAIAAKRLGFKKSAGIDIDRVALGVARKNARINRARITVGAGPLEKVRGSFGVVAANIISRELKRLAPALVKKTAPGGFLILSGILGHEQPGIIEFFNGLGLEYRKGFTLGEWGATVFVKP